MPKFQPGHRNLRRRPQGVPCKATESRDELIQLGLKPITPEEIDQLSPLTILKLITLAQYKTGDHRGAARSAAVPPIQLAILNTTMSALFRFALVR
jgi:hypothetical protein